MNEVELDKALSAPLPEMIDGGFSDRVMMRAVADKARRERGIVFLLAGFAAILCALMPLTPFGQVVDDWAFHFGRELSRAADDASNLANLAVPLALAAGALTLAALVMQSIPGPLKNRPTSGPRTSS